MHYVVLLARLIIFDSKFGRNKSSSNCREIGDVSRSSSDNRRSPRRRRTHHDDARPGAGAHSTKPSSSSGAARRRDARDERISQQTRNRDRERESDGRPRPSSNAAAIPPVGHMVINMKTTITTQGCHNGVIVQSGIQGSGVGASHGSISLEYFFEKKYYTKLHLLYIEKIFWYCFHTFQNSVSFLDDN